ncbi:serine/threonine-protein kinase [Streptomyces sp. RKAG293]|uniref:serine/threonine-protein kinase n=1 Tax=Streptomyces sp. RKAG293 TaxID=2893403 RepID=UPI002033D859|nr:serine/threonine-protein kinase [Streptomyces sp. RKAG293]MCM2416544.1 serine/threonine protein kinase [Streptomyces sp. RKAG293]
MNDGGAGSRTIDGRFELLERLGGGGMGLVWRARDLVLDREVALKEVRPPDPAMAAADPAGTRLMRERVLREAQALARLQHPNVVTIHHIIDTPASLYPWLVMELVHGGSLADRLARGPLTVREAARTGRGVLAALRAAHDVGVQHRDIKPGNILLRTNGTPVVTDFGIAVLHGSTALTATGALVGSPEFMAPERIRGHEGNPASDLWSLGMTLYIALEGHHPLRRASTFATLAAVLDEPLPPPQRCGPLAPLLTALLVKDPIGRPDAEQIDRMLAAAEHHESAPPAGPAPAFGPPPEKFHRAWPPSAYGSAAPGPSAAPAPPARSGAPARRLPLKHSTGTWAPSARRRRSVVSASCAAVVVLAGALAWVLIPRGGHPAGRAATPPSRMLSTPATSSALDIPSAPGGQTPGTDTPVLSTPATSDSLLTPAGVRRAIAAIRPLIAGGRVREFIVYADYATAEAPLASNPKLYDDFTFRAGKVTHSPGGAMQSGDATESLDSFDWDALPRLFDTAAKTLGVTSPTSRYITVDRDVFDGIPTMNIYFSDAYGGGYLSAGATGKVKSTHPRGGS